MKKTLILWLLLAGLAVISLPAALIVVNIGKDRIVISEEVLSGDPAAAEGIVLRIPAHWGRRLLWDTEYTIGEGSTESSFAFSSRQVSWQGQKEKVEAGLSLQINYDITETYTAGSARFDWESLSREIIDGVAERTGNGEKHTEVVRLGDYSPCYPLAFMIEGNSVSYEGDYVEACGYLRDFFQIRTAEDSVEVTVEKDAWGERLNVAFRHLDSEEDVVLRNAAADGGAGIYFVYCLQNEKTKEWADRGCNRGIFYFPYREENGFWRVDLTEVRRLQDFPEDMIPVEMLAGEGGDVLYLVIEEKDGYSLLVYRLEGEIPVLARRIPVKTGHEPFCRMSEEEGGILLTWTDNSFSFVAEEAGEYRQWCRGVFPETMGQDGYGGNPFPEEQACLFDGERLALAAYGDWHSLDVLLAVYDEQGQTYSGRYVHDGNDDGDGRYDRNSMILPQGVRAGQWGNGQPQGGRNGKAVEPLEIFGRSER